jgi:hypothetical protein
MNGLQYLMLGMSAFAIVYSPFLIAKSVRRKQYYRIFEVPIATSMVVYIAVSVVWPSAIQNAPPIVHRLLPVLFVLWVLDYVGFFRWLFNRHRKRQI